MWSDFTHASSVSLIVVLHHCGPLKKTTPQHWFIHRVSRYHVVFLCTSHGSIGTRSMPRIDHIRTLDLLLNFPSNSASSSPVKHPSISPTACRASSRDVFLSCHRNLNMNLMSFITTGVAPTFLTTQQTASVIDIRVKGVALASHAPCGCCPPCPAQGSAAVSSGSFNNI